MIRASWMDEATRHDIRKRSTARERIWGALRIAAMVAIVSLWGVQVGPTSTSATSSVREDSQVQLSFSDYKLYGLQARSYSALGRRLQQHRAQAEFYFLQGQLGQAVEQLQFAQQATDGNFYEKSAADARLRELRKLLAEEAKLKKDGG